MQSQAAKVTVEVDTMWKKEKGFKSALQKIKLIFRCS